MNDLDPLHICEKEFLKIFKRTRSFHTRFRQRASAKKQRNILTQLKSTSRNNSTRDGSTVMIVINDCKHGSQLPIFFASLTLFPSVLNTFHSLLFRCRLIALWCLCARACAVYIS